MADRLERVRRWTRKVGIVAGCVAAASCSDSSSINGIAPGHARLSLAPQFATTPAGGPVVTLSRIDAYLIGPTNDSTFATSPFVEGTATLSFDVQVPGGEAEFILDVTGFDANGVEAYHARQTYIIKPGDNSGLEAPTLVYSAPDSKVTSLHVSSADLVLNSGATTTLSVTGTDAQSAPVSPIRVGWTSKDESIATVNDAGAVVAGQFQGKTYIVARTATGVADSALVSVHAPVDHIVVGPQSVEVVRGRTFGVMAELRDAGNHLIDDRSATFSISDQSVATITSLGVVSGIKIGTATITASAEGKTATIPVSVVSPIASVEITPATINFSSLGESQVVTTHLVARTGEVVDTFTTTLANTNPNVAGFDGNTLYAFSNGSTVIRATADGVVGTANVTVQQVPASMTLTPAASMTLLTGGLGQISARLQDARQNAIPNATITWSSSNSAVATVSGSGLVTAVASGTATITATAGTLSKSIAVTVSTGLFGRVVGAPDGAPISGATVTYASGNATTTTNADGTFTLSNVPLGATLQVAATGWVGTSYDNVGTTNGSIGTIPLVGSATTASASYSGHFVDATTRGHIPSVRLTVRPGVNNTSGTTITQQFTTDTTGAFTLVLAPGTYTVSASAGGYITSAVTLAAVGGNTVSNFDVVVPPAATGNTIRVVLTWGAEPSDLDSHLIIPIDQSPNEVAYYQDTVRNNTTLEVLGTLDHDETDGFGPETITIPTQIAGTYHYFVHHYSGSSTMSATGPIVDVYRGPTQIAHFVAPPNQGCGENDIWSVFDLNGTTLTPLNFISCSSSGEVVGYGARRTMTVRANQALIDRVRRGAAAHPKPTATRP